MSFLRIMLLVGIVATTTSACGRVSYDLLDRSPDTRLDGGGLDGGGLDGGGLDGGVADAGFLDGGGTADAGPVSDADVGGEIPVCSAATCTCPAGQNQCEVLCFAEPCGVACDGDTTCVAHCWSGVNCSASWEGASASGGAPAPGIVSVTAGRGINTFDDVIPPACGAACLCPSGCTEVGGVSIADCGGRTAEPAGCEMTCDPAVPCSLYCGAFSGECAIQCGPARCVGTPNAWVSCVAGTCIAGPPA